MTQKRRWGLGDQTETGTVQYHNGDGFSDWSSLTETPVAAETSPGFGKWRRLSGPEIDDFDFLSESPNNDDGCAIGGLLVAFAESTNSFFNSPSLSPTTCADQTSASSTRTNNNEGSSKPEEGGGHDSSSSRPNIDNSTQEVQGIREGVMNDDWRFRMGSSPSPPAPLSAMMAATDDQYLTSSSLLLPKFNSPLSSPALPPTNNWFGQLDYGGGLSTFNYCESYNDHDNNLSSLSPLSSFTSSFMSPPSSFMSPPLYFMSPPSSFKSSHQKDSDDLLIGGSPGGGMIFGTENRPRSRRKGGGGGTNRGGKQQQQLQNRKLPPMTRRYDKNDAFSQSSLLSSPLMLPPHHNDPSTPILFRDAVKASSTPSSLLPRAASALLESMMMPNSGGSIMDVSSHDNVASSDFMMVASPTNTISRKSPTASPPVALYPAAAAKLGVFGSPLSPGEAIEDSTATTNPEALFASTSAVNFLSNPPPAQPSPDLECATTTTTTELPSSNSTTEKKDLAAPAETPSPTDQSTAVPLGGKFLPLQIGCSVVPSSWTETADNNASTKSSRQNVLKENTIKNSNNKFLEPKREDNEGGDTSKADSRWYQRPDIDSSVLDQLCDIQIFNTDPNKSKLIEAFREGITFPLGEGGRELLRACLIVKGCKGKELQGASVPKLLELAQKWNLWNVALRIKIERHTNELSPHHDAFVRFKANQSQLRKFQRREFMQVDKDQTGRIKNIFFEASKSLTLGKEGRECLRAQLRRLHDEKAARMDQLLEMHGFKYSELRNATVSQLIKMAHVCNLWDGVVEACRKQDDKKLASKQKKAVSPLFVSNDERKTSPIKNEEQTVWVVKNEVPSVCQTKSTTSEQTQIPIKTEEDEIVASTAAIETSLLLGDPDDDDTDDDTDDDDEAVDVDELGSWLLANNQIAGLKSVETFLSDVLKGIRNAT